MANTGKEAAALKRELAQSQHKVKKLNDEIEILKEQRDGIMVKLNNMRYELQYRDEELNKIDVRSNFLKDDSAYNAKRAKYEAQEKQIDLEDRIRTLLLEFINPSENIPKANPTAADHVEEPKQKTQCHTVKIRYIATLFEEEDDLQGEAKHLVYEGLFRINQYTTFTFLKTIACRYWGIAHESEMILSHATSQKFEDSEVVHKQLAELSMAPELFLHQKHTVASLLIGADEVAGPGGDEKGGDKVKGGTEDDDKEKRDFNKMLEHYPGLKSYIPYRSKASIDAEREKRLESPESSCCTAAVLVLLFSLTMYVIMSRRDMTFDYWTHEGIHEHLMDAYDGEKDFYSIRTWEEVHLWFQNVASVAIFRNSFGEHVMHNVKFVGKFRLRQVQTKITDWDKAGDYEVMLNLCYYEKYKSDTRNEADIGLTPAGLIPDNPWNKFKDESDADVDSIIDGKFSNYDGSGYYRDFDHNLKSHEFIAQYQEFINDQWFGLQTRAIIGTFTIYIPSSDVWVSSMILIEISVTGNLSPTIIKSEVFKPNLFETELDKSIQIADIFRLLFSLYMFQMFFRTVFSPAGGQRNIPFVYSVRGLMDVAAFAFSIAGFVLSYKLQEDSTDLVTSDKHVDTLTFAKDYNLSLIFYSICLFMIFIRLVIIARINRNIHIILLTIETATFNVKLYLVVLCPILLGVVMISISLWGLEFEEFSTFEGALTQNLLFCIGHGQIMELIKKNYAWGVLYFIMYFFCVIFFLLSVFMGIYMDAYRLVRLREGYDDKGASWTVFRWMRWVCSLIPKRVQEALMLRNLAKKKKANQKEEEAIEAEEEINQSG